EVVPAGPGVQEPDSYPKEAGEQHKVGGLGHEYVVRRDPADHGQLGEQHQEAGEDQPALLPPLLAEPVAVIPLFGTGACRFGQLSCRHDPTVTSPCTVAPNPGKAPVPGNRARPAECEA